VKIQPTADFLSKEVLQYYFPEGRTVTEKTAELLDKSPLYEGFFNFTLYKLRHSLFRGGNSRAFTREILERNPVAALLPYDPVRDAVVLIEQFRPGAFAANWPSPWIIEVVAGIIEPGETAEEMVRREAMEEAGCTVSDLEPIVTFFPSAGGCSEVAHFFCGRVDATNIGGIHGVEHEDEDIRVFVESTDDALKMLDAGEIQSSIGVIGLLWLARHREKLRARWS